jgi:hypothetical protein
MNSMNFVKLMELKDNFSLQETPQQNGPLKGKIELFKKQPRLCEIKPNSQIYIGEK